MEIILTIIAIIGGIVAVIQVFQWKKEKKIKIVNPLKKEKTIILECNKENQLLHKDEDLLNKTREIIFQLRSEQPFTLGISFQGLDDARNNYNKLLRKKNLTTIEQRQRNLCQKYFKDLDKKSNKISEIIILIFSQCDDLYSSFGENTFSEILVGIFNQLSSSAMRQGTKIDVWKEKKRKFTTAIDVTPKELEQILKKLNLQNSQMLACGPGNYWVLDLPSLIVHMKVIPAIAFHLSWLADRENQDIKTLSHSLNLLDWSIGLG